jgi:hypothetical protein
MSNKRITDLTELTTPTTDDVFPVVDIASNTTTKVQLGNLPTTTAVTTALATKQDTLVSGTNIKTVNSTSLVGSGNVAVQETLVSGTNIKTLNSTSLLGSGNIVLTANPSGVAGAIQFSNGSAFASDASNLFWDDTNNRLGIGTNAPTGKTQITESFTTTGNNYSAITFDGTLTSRATASDTIFGFRNTQSIVATALSQTIIANDLSPDYTFFNANTNYIGLKVGGSSNTQNLGTAIWCTQKTTAGNNGLAINPYNNRWAIGMTSATSNTITGCDLILGLNGVGIGISGSNPTTRLQIQGSGSTSATTSLLVQNSAGTTLMSIADNGAISIGAGNITTLSGTVANYTGPIQALYFVNASSPFQFGIASVYGITGTTPVVTSGQRDGFLGQFTFAPTSGTAILNVINASPTINQTGGANGITRALYINPTLTAAADFRAIEVSIGGAYINTTSVQASAILQADSTTKGFLPPRMTTTQKNAIATPAAGLVVYDSTTNKLCCYNGSTWNDLF